MRTLPCVRVSKECRAAPCNSSGATWFCVLEPHSSSALTLPTLKWHCGAMLVRMLCCQRQSERCTFLHCGQFHHLKIRHAKNLPCRLQPVVVGTRAAGYKFSHCRQPHSTQFFRYCRAHKPSLMFDNAAPACPWLFAVQHCSLRLPNFYFFAVTHTQHICTCKAVVEKASISSVNMLLHMKIDIASICAANTALHRLPQLMLPHCICRATSSAQKWL